MTVIAGDLLTIEGEKYITLEVLNYGGVNYAFVNKMTNEEEATDEFYIFEVLDDGVKMIVEDDLKNVLIPKFQDMLQNDIKKLME